MQNVADKIAKTKEGYPVKNLKWNERDSIFVGLVKDPVYGRADLFGGFICVQWNRQGKPLKVNKGRKELILDL